MGSETPFHWRNYTFLWIVAVEILSVNFIETQQARVMWNGMAAFNESLIYTGELQIQAIHLLT